MGKLNTAANISSAFSNHAVARSSAETSASTAKLASSDRHRELRERGLITHRSTPADIAAVEAELDAQMRARMWLQGSPLWNRRPYAGVIAAVVVALMLIAPMFGGDKPWLALLLMAPVLGGGAFVASRVQARENERAELIARADWDDHGTCRWCGTAEVHIVEGEEEHPRVAHARELEQQVGPIWVQV